MYFLNNIVRFSVVLFILIKSVFLHATQEQCQYPDYTSRCSIIRIIPFDESLSQIDYKLPMMDCFSAQQIESFVSIAKKVWAKTVSDEYSWVNNPAKFINDSLTQINYTTVDTYINDSIAAIIQGLNGLHEQKGNENVDVSSSVILDFSILGNTATTIKERLSQNRLLCGQCSARQECADIERYGFRRYLRNPKKKPTDPNNFRPSEFNYGRSFIYPTEEQLQQIGLPEAYSPDNDHIKITETLAKYASTIDDDKNALFIKISVKSGETLLYDILCGTFLSGSEKVTSVNKDPTDLIDIPDATYKTAPLTEISDRKKLKVLEDEWEDVKLYTALHCIRDTGIPRLMKIYSKRTFGMPDSNDLSLGNKRFPLYNGDPGKLIRQVKDELVKPEKERLIQEDFLGRMELLYGESVFLDRMDIYNESKLKGILSEEFGRCFHQSEEYFISFLKQESFTSLQDHLNVKNYVDEGVQLPVPTDIVIYCYDRKDTCRYCRATLSYMLRTESLQEKIKEFIEEAIKKPGIFSQGNINVHMYAFAKETTEL